MGYKLMEPGEGVPGMQLPPELVVDEASTTSWRDAKKALRQWYLDQAAGLRSVSEADMFPK